MTVEIRDARPEDSAQIVELVRLLGHQVDAEGVRSRLEYLQAQNCPQLVATEGEQVLGLCGVNRTIAIQRTRPVGRVSILVLAEGARDRGLGRRLIEEAERRFRAMGCGLIEITSNLSFVDAHGFYEHLGYERTSYRFFKEL